MRKSKTTKRALLSSAMALFLCFTMLLGTTFAWFTDSVSSANNIIKSGNLDVNLYYWDNSMATGTSVAIEDASNLKLLRNVDGEEILWEPGATGFGQFEVANEGSLALKYQLNLNFYDATETTEGKTLADVLSVYAIARNGKTGEDAVMEDANLETLRSSYIDSFVPGYESQSLTDFVLEGYLLPGESFKYEIGAFWEPSDKDNEYNVDNGLSINFGVTLLATQMTYEKDAYDNQYDKDATYPEIADRWDGTVDTSWYNNTDTEFIITTAEQLAGLAVVAGTTDQFEGKTIKLVTDIDLAGKSFAPIGTTGERDNQNRLITEPFKGTFDGNGHTISNLSQSGWDFGYEWGKYGSLGMFSELENATVKNVVLEGFDCAVEGGDVAFIAGSATGDCLFENIEIKSGGIGTYNNGIGTIVGWSGAGNYTFKNIKIGKDVILGGLWGSFDSSVGGIVGQAEPGASYHFENVDIACQLDVYNDVTAAYKYYIYRMSGMLIGRLEETTTIDGSNYPDMSKYNITCENVTVTYGDWMNYHYCVVAGKTAWRHEPGYAYDGIPADHDHSTCAMHCNLLLPFEGLFGGAQYGVNPIKTYDGVTINYPNNYIP